MSNSLQPHGMYSSWNSLGQNNGVGSLSLLQGIFLTQGSNSGLPHFRQILYQLSHKEAQCIQNVSYMHTKYIFLKLMKKTAVCLPRYPTPFLWWKLVLQSGCSANDYIYWPFNSSHQREMRWILQNNGMWS